MAIKTIYIGSWGPLKYDDTDDVADPDGLFPGIKQKTIVTDGTLDATVVQVVTLEAEQVDNITTQAYFFGSF
jgi:hypothetical protein